jgi:hypothetical protein
MDQWMDWLLGGPPWVEYNTRLDLLGEKEDAPEVRASREAMLGHPEPKMLINDLGKWPGSILKSHKSAGHALHKLVFIADLGFRADDEGIPKIIHQIKAHQSKEGPYQVLMNISPKYGGLGEDQYVWLLCDAPLILYALTKFGLGGAQEVQDAVSYLVDIVRDNGWPCAGASELGKFRGPGRKADPCPYATLLMLKLLAQYPDHHTAEHTKVGIETLLSLWEQRRERRPYLFAMGSGFTNLKAPLIWYDLLNLTDVLSRFDWVRGDNRFLEMVHMIKSKEDENGRYTCESVWRDWKAWYFGQKREPSSWLTFIAHRMLKRMNV